MAALEKIRKRAVILTVVIGAGLLAFILEEGVRASSSFFNDTTAAKVGSEKIDVQEFNKRYETISQQNRNNQQKTDAAVEQQQVLQQMVSDAILTKECEENGIGISAAELEFIVNHDQQFQGWFSQYLQSGRQNVQTAGQLDKMIQNNPEQFGEFAAVWNQYKESIAKEFLKTKVASLISGLIQPNDLDIQAMQEGMDEFEVQFAKADYSTLDDAKYKPTNDEVKAVYDELKGLFKITDEQRRIHFIASEITPNKTDLDKGKAIVNKAYTTIQGENGLDSLRNISEFSNINLEKLTAKQVQQADQSFGGDSTFYNFVTKSAPGATWKYENGNSYTIFKLKSIQQLTDSATVSIALVQGDKKKQDSYLASLNAGKDLSKDQNVEIQPAQKIDIQHGLVAGLQQQGVSNTDEILKKIELGDTSYIVAFSDAKQGAMFIKVNKATKATYYELGGSSYAIEASQATINSIQDRLENFLQKNNTAELFAKNAAKAGFAAQELIISPSTAQLPGGMANMYGRQAGIENTRKAIRWAMTEAKKGEVSNVFTDNNDVLIAIAVDEIYDGEFLPLTVAEVKQTCERIAMNRKKAEAMTKMYANAGKTIADYANKMKSQAETATVSFMSQQVNSVMPGSLMGDAGFIGRVVGTGSKEVKNKKAASVQTWAGNNAFFAYTVTKYAKNKVNLKAEDLKNQWLQQYGVFYNPQQRMDNFSSVLMSSEIIKNNLIKFQ